MKREKSSQTANKVEHHLRELQYEDSVVKQYYYIRNITACFNLAERIYIKCTCETIYNIKIISNQQKYHPGTFQLMWY